MKKQNDDEWKNIDETIADKLRCEAVSLLDADGVYEEGLVIGRMCGAADVYKYIRGRLRGRQ